MIGTMDGLGVRPAADAVRETVAHVLAGRRKATKYLSSKVVIKASGQRPIRRNAGSVTVIVTVGRPNYAERRFISQCRKVGEGFPVRRVQLKEWR